MHAQGDGPAGSGDWEDSSDPTPPALFTAPHRDTTAGANLLLDARRRTPTPAARATIPDGLELLDSGRRCGRPAASAGSVHLAKHDRAGVRAAVRAERRHDGEVKPVTSIDLSTDELAPDVCVQGRELELAGELAGSAITGAYRLCAASQGAERRN